MAFRTPLWTSGQSHTADVLRTLTRSLLGSGVPGQSDLFVGPRSAGANMSVDVGAGRCVVSDYVCWSDAEVNLTIGAPPAAGQSRIDSIQAKVTDAGDGLGSWAVVVVPGVSSASPSPPAVSGLAVELGRVTVKSGMTSVTGEAITDRRPSAFASRFRYALPPTGVEGQIVVLPDGDIATSAGGGWAHHERQDTWPKVIQNIQATVVKQIGSGTLLAASGLPLGVPLKLWVASTVTVVAENLGTESTTAVSVNYKVTGTGFSDIVTSSVSGFADRLYNGANLPITMAQTVIGASNLNVSLMYDVAAAPARLTTRMSIMAFPA